MNTGSRFFYKLSLVTLVAVYVLILVGGIVRSTGSGMGCPDWPKCFGQWVPPSDVSQLPENYKEVYAQKRAVKNERFAQYLTILGFEKTAQELLNDESILVEADFNKNKTLVEYLNRLTGVIIGLLIIGTFIASLQFLKKNKTITYVAFASLLLVIFQGWIGSVVVSTNLIHWMVTVHMLLALLLIMLLIFLVHRAKGTSTEAATLKHPRRFSMILIVCMIMMLVQIVLGTQVREAIDMVAASFDNTQRQLWIGELGTSFIIHRSYSLLIFGAHFWLFYELYISGSYDNIARALVVVVVLSIFTGIAMAYLAIPPAIQPVHLLLGTLAFGLQYLLYLRSRKGIIYA